MQQLKEVQILARFEFQNPPNPPTQRFTSLILQQQRMPRVAMGYFLLCSSTHFVAQVLSLRYKCLTLTLNPFLSSTYQKLYRPRLTALEKVVASGVPKKLATAFAASLTSVPFIQFSRVLYRSVEQVKMSSHQGNIKVDQCDPEILLRKATKRGITSIHGPGSRSRPRSGACTTGHPFRFILGVIDTAPRTSMDFKKIGIFLASNVGAFAQRL